MILEGKCRMCRTVPIIQASLKESSRFGIRPFNKLFQ